LFSETIWKLGIINNFIDTVGKKGSLVRTKKVPRYLTREQLQQLRKHVEGKKGERALIEVLCAT
jgi:hypothetical protein